MKVIIAGSRHITSPHYLDNALYHVQETLHWDITEIVCGMAKGADTLGAQWAKENNIVVAKFPADWSKGPGAGHMRNVEMANYADALIALWDGKSNGTRHMIKCMQNRWQPKPIFVYRIDTIA